MLRPLIWVLALGIFSPPAYACSCGRIASAAEAHAYSDVVFEGTVVAKTIVLDRATFAPNEQWLVPIEEYTFAVTRARKGVSSPAIRLRQGFSNCDNLFSGGESYLVFASRLHTLPTRYSSGKCGPTKRLSEARSDLVALGAPAASFGIATPPGSKLTWFYFVRLYLWSGMATYANVVRHPGNAFLWRVTVPGNALLLIALALIASTIVPSRRRSRRVAAIFLLLAGLFIIGSVLISGGSLLRSGYYAHYKDW